MIGVMRAIIMTMFCFGCSDPFSIDRHDLVDPRIAGVRKGEEGYIAQVWNGSAAFHQQTPKIVWFDDEGLEIGKGVVFGDETAVPVALEYEDPRGEIQYATFAVEEAEDFFSISMQTVTESSSYALEARQEQVGVDIFDGIAAEQTRLTADVGDQQKLRWMTSQGIGSFLELNRTAADFYWKDIILDRDEVEKDEAISEQYTSVFALSINQEGHNQWQWTDLWRASEANYPSLLRHQNRYFPIDLEIEEETLIRVSIEQDDSLFGFQFTNPEIITENTELPASLECALREETFQWWWIEVGICTIDDVVGEDIVLQVSP